MGIRPTYLRPAIGDELIVVEEVVRRYAFLGALLRLTVDPPQVHVFAPDGQAVTHGV